jgi:methylglutaconyl-CoA hydratase
MSNVYSTIRVQTANAIATVSLARVDHHNAFDQMMIRELTVAFTTLNERHDLAAVVLRGEGKSFCSGADLGYMKAQSAFTGEENETDADRLFSMFWALRSCPHPLIGRVHGNVMGGGLGLMAVCDVVAAVEGTKFCFTEVKLGLAPAVISPFVLERMSVSQARRFMLTGEIFDTDVALSTGLVHFKGDEPEADIFVNKLSAQLTQNGPEAMRATKGLFRALYEIDDWDQRRELTTKVIAERRKSAEGQEGLKSFFEKRAPNWRSN